MSRLGPLILSLSIFAFGVPQTALAKPVVGEPAPDSSLVTLSGEPRTLSSYRGKGIILNFWATWCVPCREEMPHLNKIYDIYKERGIVILGVNYKQKKKSVERYIKKVPISFPILMDLEGKFSDPFNLKALPTTYFIDKNGAVAGLYSGPLTMENLKEWAEKLSFDQR